MRGGVSLLFRRESGLKLDHLALTAQPQIVSLLFRRESGLKLSITPASIRRRGSFSPFSEGEWIETNPLDRYELPLPRFSPFSEGEWIETFRVASGFVGWRRFSPFSEGEWIETSRWIWTGWLCGVSLLFRRESGLKQLIAQLKPTNRPVSLLFRRRVD